MTFCAFLMILAVLSQPKVSRLAGRAADHVSALAGWIAHQVKGDAVTSNQTALPSGQGMSGSPSGLIGR